MPSSEKRIAASRANGAKSHGPTTPEGKRNSSRNATRHGILANSVVLEGESRERFAALVNSYTAELLPTTPTERLLIERLPFSTGVSSVSGPLKPRASPTKCAARPIR